MLNFRFSFWPSSLMILLRQFTSRSVLFRFAPDFGRDGSDFGIGLADFDEEMVLVFESVTQDFLLIFNSETRSFLPALDKFRYFWSNFLISCCLFLNPYVHFLLKQVVSPLLLYWPELQRPLFLETNSRLALTLMKSLSSWMLLMSCKSQNLRWLPGDFLRRFCLALQR